MEFIRLIDVIIFSFIVLSLSLLFLAVKATVEHFSLQKKIDQRNQMLKREFRITEDIF